MTRAALAVLACLLLVPAVASASDVYQVGAANKSIEPTGLTNLGGYGLGDGSLFPDAVTSRGGQDRPGADQIQARALVVSDSAGHTVVLASIETQGMFAAYEDGPYGLSDIAADASKVTGIPADHILITSDHTHHGPDTIGAWGGVPASYLQYIHDQTVAAIKDAFDQRQSATLSVGQSDAPDLIYNQSCSEALNQSKTPDYPGPDLCATPGKDGEFRVLQAKALDGSTVATYTAYAAHATAGGGNGINGDWPQYISDASAAAFGGVGIAVEGANGGTQPCRTACAFTDPKNPGYNINDRKASIVANYMAHVHDAIVHSEPVNGPVAAAQGVIREAITGPAVTALFMGGQYGGARLLRSHESPWVVGQTIRTITSAVRVGDVLFAGTPGEGFPAIGDGVRSAVGSSAHMVFQLGLADDQLGYLIAPVSYVPVIAAEVGVNDNIIFNVSPTIGDHVMCSDIGLAAKVGFSATSPPTCAAYDAADSAGDPVGQVPVGGVVLPGGGS
jgi:hypothetical protein